MMVDSNRAILEIRRAFPTMRAKTLKVRAPKRPNFNAARANTGPKGFWRPLPLSYTFGGFIDTPEIKKKIFSIIYTYYLQQDTSNNYRKDLNFKFKIS